MKNNRNVTFVSRPCFDNMFHVIYAHEWMNNAQVHEMQVQLCKQNTRGVTVVNQVVEEVNPSVEVGFDICGTTPEPDFSANQGKPRMHLNLPCVLQIYIAFAFKYCIK